MVLPLLSHRSPTAQTSALLMAAICVKLPARFTCSTWDQDVLLATAGPDAASPAVAASTVAAPAIQRLITPPRPKGNGCSAVTDIVPLPEGS